MATERQKAIARHLTLLIPRVPFLDAEAIRTDAGSKHMRDLTPAAAIWLATVAHIRHQHTDYDELRDEGYERDEARFFVLEAVNEVLDRWGSTRPLLSEPDADEEVSEGDDEEPASAIRQRPDAD
ncbi:DUF2293 domain-containing protein [Aureimonas sp. AU12]|uniref:DUF2293 domain-containing protein n=1 Tax=Aureimonas sp. AU12 TaxID=1638161 RepID=UPI000782F671|nr:DUF2293 domain-containing protein [Aureimonas sp. AU12]